MFEFIGLRCERFVEIVHALVLGLEGTAVRLETPLFEPDLGGRHCLEESRKSLLGK